MALKLVQVGNDEDGMPIYDWEDDGVYDTDPGVITGPGSVPGSGGGVGAVTGTGGDASLSGDINWGKAGEFFKGVLSGKGSPADYAALLTLIGGLSGMNKPQGSPGFRGKINPNKYTFNQKQIAQPTYVPYSSSAAPVMGRKNFEDPTYTVKAAEGGIMGLARGGSAKPPRYLDGATDGMADKLPTNIDGGQAAALSHGEFVIPADVVSHLGNGNSEAGADQLYKMMDRIRLARTGSKKQGKRINPEKFTPGGIAGYAGGGVVAFATGGTPSVTSQQGTANSSPVTSESNLSEWAAPGVVNYIEQGTALARQPYQAYTGPLTAGTSPLQTQAFDTASKLAPSANLGKAATMLDTAGTNLGKLSYSASPVSSAYTAPAGYSAGSIGNTYSGTGAYNPQAATSQYTGTGAYNAQNATNQFSGPAAYQTGDFSNQYGGIAAYTPQTASNQFQGPAAYQNSKFDTQYVGTDPYETSGMQLDKFNTANMRQYMNPYLEMSLEPQIEEARRQSQITQMGNASKLAQAGAYGGSRGALMDTETQRNLLQNLAAITGQGYNTAFDKATSAFNTQQGLGLQAQQANEASRQFGANQALTNAQNTAKFGMDALAAAEASKQFGAGQAMTAAQQAAQYGQAANQLSAQERQFGSSQALANAQTKAQYGQAAEAAKEASRQFGAGQAMAAAQSAAQYGQAAQAQNAQQQQFAASQALANAQNAAQFGQAAQAQNVQQQQFGTSQALANAQNAAQYGLAGFTANEQAKQAQGLQALSGAQNAAQYGQAAQALNAQQQQFGANLGLSGLQGQISAGTALGGLGIQEGQLGLANLNTMSNLGATQRDIEQQGIDALYKQYEQERLDPYKQLQFEQSLYSGLPLSTITGSTATSPFQELQGAINNALAMRGTIGGIKP